MPAIAMLHHKAVSLIIALLLVLVILLCETAAGAPASGVRLKDLTKIEGVRENQLIGYGLVVGLAGTGDRLQNTPFTERSLTAMLERLGVAVTDENLLTRNTAAVIVTASLPGFSRNGDQLDVAVSAMGDARSLQGGTLLATPLLGADGNVYAVSQGSLVISGFEAGGQAAQVRKGVPTSARIPNGATVERELTFDMNSLSRVRYVLRTPDFTTASRVVKAVNNRLEAPVAKALDHATVDVMVPPVYESRVTEMIAAIEDLEIETDELARVVINESSGTIVIGAAVRISEVAVTQGNITIQVSESPIVSQPAPFARRGETVAVPRTQLGVDEGGAAEFKLLGSGVTLQDLVNGLNALGVPPGDVISILQSIKAAGALHAELIVQ